MMPTYGLTKFLKILEAFLEQEMVYEHRTLKNFNDDNFIYF